MGHPFERMVLTKIQGVDLLTFIVGCVQLECGTLLVRYSDNHEVELFLRVLRSNVGGSRSLRFVGYGPGITFIPCRRKRVRLLSHSVPPLPYSAASNSQHQCQRQRASEYAIHEYLLCNLSSPEDKSLLLTKSLPNEKGVQIGRAHV